MPTRKRRSFLKLLVLAASVCASVFLATEAQLDLNKAARELIGAESRLNSAGLSADLGSLDGGKSVKSDGVVFSQANRSRLRLHRQASTVFFVMRSGYGRVFCMASESQGYWEERPLLFEIAERECRLGDCPKPLDSAPWQLDSFRRIRRMSFPSFENFGAEISAPNCQVGKRAFGTVPRLALDKEAKTTLWDDLEIYREARSILASGRFEARKDRKKRQQPIPNHAVGRGGGVWLEAFNRALQVADKQLVNLVAGQASEDSEDDRFVRTGASSEADRKEAAALLLSLLDTKRELASLAEDAGLDREGLDSLFSEAALSLERKAHRKFYVFLGRCFSLDILILSLLVAGFAFRRDFAVCVRFSEPTPHGMNVRFLHEIVLACLIQLRGFFGLVSLWLSRLDGLDYAIYPALDQPSALLIRHAPLRC